MTDDELHELLPPVLAEVAGAAGLRAALVLAAELGGTLVYVPRRPKAGTLLVKAVGMEAAKAIAGLWPGENVEIPLGPSDRRQRIKARVKAMLDDGLAVQAIARELGVHCRTVRRHKNKAANQNEPDLFSLIDT